MKKSLIWLLAVIITIAASVYQRMTGPTNPKKAEVQVNGQVYRIKLVRSLGLDEQPVIQLAIYDSTVSARLYYKRFKTSDDYTETEFKYRIIPVNSFIMNKIFDINEIKGFFASVPQQPPAGKLQYYIEITDNAGTKTLFKENPIVVRFKGAVPGWALVPHIIIMFIAMLFSTLAGIMAIARNTSYKKYAVWTLILITAGGLIFGPIVQYYAFGQLWTGVPFGWDLTDNKTLIAFIFWLLAVIMNRKKERPLYTVLAAFILLIVFSIPHSLLGSELDYESGKVLQGYLSIFFG
ncbi:MAG TPA: hypothetical protein PLN06_07730 [Bacteroidales bacterium]|nr:hypothetical protein [Bacteroidales bacterium]HCI54807.1 hypothetical protein [Bacteroidales bacterium]HOU96498.1 hypothetical protein [Bacteroidales bacterium]HQG36888.1 hypothetical protein [Bacteroidales bacterium]HQG53464.1 hypothetical protein [Bacteroidales bacterium]